MTALGVPSSSKLGQFLESKLGARGHPFSCSDNIDVVLADMDAAICTACVAGVKYTSLAVDGTYNLAKTATVAGVCQYVKQFNGGTTWLVEKLHAEASCVTVTQTLNHKKLNILVYITEETGLIERFEAEVSGTFPVPTGGDIAITGTSETLAMNVAHANPQTCGSSRIACGGGTFKVSKA